MLEWVDIPAGSVTLESGQTFPVKPFRMSKYPVTYAQFQAFVDAPDGFYDDRWWVGLAADADHRSAPGEQEWPIDNHPRERVSWYDAVAFCRWLSSKLGQEVRLPTEWEWQWAAQGGDGRAYPWGNDFDASRCNTDESGLGRTTPVDAYPSGASPFGVMDMAGNVWEWCLNEYETPANTRLDGDASRVLRGGSWLNYGGLIARAVCRFRGLPNYRGLDDFGFRVVGGAVPI
jgi:formylglycine-generating enzyme required for sulfatase activity